MPYLLTPTEPRVKPVTLYPTKTDDLPRLVADHYAKHRHLVPGLRHDIELTAGDPIRGRIRQRRGRLPRCASPSPGRTDLMTETEVKPHPFRPSVDGMTCTEIRYPAWTYCNESVDSPVHTGTRATPPELEFPTPPCSICGEGTHWDEGFRCDPCGASWNDAGQDGLWDEPNARRCTATSKPFDRPGLAPEHEGIRHHISHCTLAADHDGEHRADAFTTWANEVES